MRTRKTSMMYQYSFCEKAAAHSMVAASIEDDDHIGWLGRVHGLADTLDLPVQTQAGNTGTQTVVPHEKQKAFN